MCEHTGCALLFHESWFKFWLFTTLGTTSGFCSYSQTKFKPPILYWSSSQAIPNCNGKTSRICCSIASWYACLVYMHAPNGLYGPSWCRAERRGKARQVCMCKAVFKTPARMMTVQSICVSFEFMGFRRAFRPNRRVKYKHHSWSVRRFISKFNRFSIIIFFLFV